MSEWADHIAAAVHTAAAALLEQLANVQRGWTTLTHDDPLVLEAVALAVSEAKQRGVPVDEIDIAAQHVIAAVNEVATGAEPPADPAPVPPPVEPPAVAASDAGGGSTWTPPVAISTNHDPVASPLPDADASSSQSGPSS